MATIETAQRAPAIVFRPIQAFAGTACAILTLMVTAAGLNALLGQVPIPPIFRTWAGVTHTVIIFSALPLSAIQFFLPKGTGLHRKIGYAWAAALIVAALISFGMHIINGGLSGPHYFSMATLVLVPVIVLLARFRYRRTHKVLVISYVLFFLVLAGAFTFKGERALSQLFWSIWS